MSAARYLAVDQGGRSSRAAIFDEKGAVHARGAVNIKTCLSGDRVEHDPEELIRSIEGAIGKAIKAQEADPSGLIALGLATQRSSIVCWDREAGTALSPVISWQDRRGTAYLEKQPLDPDEIRRITGLLVSPHYGASKLRWCLDNIGGVRKALRHGRLACGPLATFVMFRLLEERPLLVDPANASRTLLWDLQRRNWSAKLLALFGIPRESLPRCVPNRHRFGTLRLGGYSVPMTVCTGDQSAAVFAAGWPHPGCVLINIGTGAFLQAIASERSDPEGRLLCSIVWQDEKSRLTALEGTVNGAAAAVTEMARRLQIPLDEVQTKADSWLATCRAIPLFLNGISGLGSPYWRADFRSAFIGDAEPAAKLVAVYESIVFLIQVNLETLRSCRLNPTRVTITGGLANLDGLCQRLANVSGQRIARPRLREATLSGLGFLIAEQPPGWHTNKHQVFEPVCDPELNARYQRWKQAMQSRI